MNKPVTKAMVRYLHPGHTYLMLGIALILFSIVSITTIFIPILCTACAALLIWLWSSSCRQFKADLAAAEQAGNLDSIAADFSESKPILRKQIRLGQRCIYGKKCGRIVSYSDIHRFSIKPNKKYLYPTCELNNGNLVTLCQLQSGKSLDQYTALLQIGNTIRSHNPSVSVDPL